jgi:hypothetical protein
MLPERTVAAPGGDTNRVRFGLLTGFPNESIAVWVIAVLAPDGNCTEVAPELVTVSEIDLMAQTSNTGPVALKSLAVANTCVSPGWLAVICTWLDCSPLAVVLIFPTAPSTTPHVIGPTSEVISVLLLNTEAWKISVWVCERQVAGGLMAVTDMPVTLGWM